MQGVSWLRASTGLPSIAGRTSVESWLDTFLSRHDEAALNDLRDKARAISAELSLEREFDILSAIIGTLLGTRDVRLTHPQTIARSQGFPYDGKRVDLFQKVAHYLNTKPPEVPKANAGTPERMQSFIESYFSNYIEGTKFQIEEALEIVNSRSPQEFREDDSHDVIGTFDAIEESKAHPVVPNWTTATKSTCSSNSSARMRKRNPRKRN